MDQSATKFQLAHFGRHLLFNTTSISLVGISMDQSVPKFHFGRHLLFNTTSISLVGISMDQSVTKFQLAHFGRHLLFNY